MNIKTIEIVSVEEAKLSKRKVKKSKAVQKVEDALTKLTSEQSGKIVAKTEKPQTIKNRISRVAKALGMNEVRVKRTGDVVYFWKEK